MTATTIDIKQTAARIRAYLKGLGGVASVRINRRWGIIYIEGGWGLGMRPEYLAKAAELDLWIGTVAEETGMTFVTREAGYSVRIWLKEAGRA